MRFGSKNGVLTTVALTLWRTASTVISISSWLPGSKWGRSIVASAIIFFSVGDQVVDVARPIWRPALETGTATRDAVAPTDGASPIFS